MVNIIIRESRYLQSLRNSHDLDQNFPEYLKVYSYQSELGTNSKSFHGNNFWLKLSISDIDQNFSVIYLLL